MKKATRLALFWFLVLAAFCGGYLAGEALARADVPTEPAVCASSRAAAHQCASQQDCSAPQICTRSIQHALAWQLTHGYCVDPTGAASATAAVQADICDLPPAPNFGGGTQYELPANSALKIVAPGITLFRKTILNGNGALLVAPSSSAPFVMLRVVVPLDHVEFVPEINGKHASWSSVRDIAFDVVPLKDNKITAILVAAHGVRVDNLQFFHVGTGLEIDGTGNKFNANDFQVSKIVSYGAYSYGGYVHGGDANGGVVHGAEIVAGVGVRDTAFLGNLWEGLQLEGNDKVSNLTGLKYSLETTGNYSSFVQTYCEASEEKPRNTSWTTLVVGGNCLSRFDIGERVGGNYSRLILRNARTAAQPYSAKIGGEDAPLRWQAYNNLGLAAEPYAHMLAWHKELDAWMIRSEAWTPGTVGGDRWSLRMRSSATLANAGAFSPGPKITPLAESGAAMCSDGIDNDGDGKIDSLDSGCAP